MNKKMVFSAVLLIGLLFLYPLETILMVLPRGGRRQMANIKEGKERR